MEDPIFYLGEKVRWRLDDSLSHWNRGRGEIVHALPEVGVYQVRWTSGELSYFGALELERLP